MATFATTKQSVLDRINTLASSSSTTAEESIYLAKALRDAAQDITFVWRGPWQATYAYVVGDVAQYDGNAYYCINAHTAGTSFSSGSGSWQTMVVGGTKFWSGSSAPTGAEDGDLFLDTDDEKLYHQVSGSWSLVVDLGGNIWTSGTTVPANSSGEDGDFFLKTDDEKLYQRESGAWTFKVDLGGSRWTSSAAAPSNSNGEQGDVHFDTATQKIYEKGASAWSELADLTPLQADWNGTGLAAILNKPTFKTIGGSNIVGSGDIAVVPADGSITDAKIAGMSSSKLSGALPAIDGSALTGISAGNYSIHTLDFYTNNTKFDESSRTNNLDISSGNRGTCTITHANDIVMCYFRTTVHCWSGYYGGHIRYGNDTNADDWWVTGSNGGEHEWSRPQYNHGIVSTQGYATGLTPGQQYWFKGVGSNHSGSRTRFNEGGTGSTHNSVFHLIHYKYEG